MAIYTVYNSGQTAYSTSMAMDIKQVFKTPFLEALDKDTTAFEIFKRRSADGDVKKEWKVRTGGNTTSTFYEETDAYGNGVQQSFASAIVQHKFARVTIEYSNVLKVANKSQWINHVADETTKGLEDFRHYLNEHTFKTGSPTAIEMDNLASIVKNTGTYAGIAYSNGYWVPVVLDNGGSARPLSIGLMEQMHIALTRPARKSKPVVILTGDTHINQYVDLAAARRRWDAGVGTIDLKAPDGAYKGIPMRPVPALEASGAQGRMFWLDTSDFYFSMLNDFETVEAPMSQDTTKLIVKVYLQLVCESPFKQGLIKDLSV